MAQYSAGQDVDAYCSKCKLVLAHVIHAMDGTTPARVECKTCRGTHAFKAQAPGARKKAGTGTKRATGTGVSKGGTSARSAAAALAAAQQDYAQAVAGRSPDDAARYTVNGEFDSGSLLQHTKFGLGVVTRTLADNKIEVLFPLGPKVLIHRRSATA